MPRLSDRLGSILVYSFAPEAIPLVLARPLSFLAFSRLQVQSKRNRLVMYEKKTLHFEHTVFHV